MDVSGIPDFDKALGVLLMVVVIPVIAACYFFFGGSEINWQQQAVDDGVGEYYYDS